MSNMYKWITRSWNPLGGACPHHCSYCYVKRGRTKNLVKYQGALRLDCKAYNKNLGRGKTWFVCSCNDLFADKVPSHLIEAILAKCRDSEDDESNNTFVFQTKNPSGLIHFEERFPDKSVFGITIETDHNDIASLAPSPIVRAKRFSDFKNMFATGVEYPQFFVTIEPIMDFDLYVMVQWLKVIEPSFVNIGADSKHSNLVEPSAEKVRELIRQLEQFTEVRIKDNLDRILKVKP